MKVKEESEKADLKFNIQKTNTMASGLLLSWQIEGETIETVRDCIFLGSKITVDRDYSHEIKRCLLLGRKSGSGWGGRWEGGSGWGRHVNPRPFHFNV